MKLAAALCAAMASATAPPRISLNLDQMTVSPSQRKDTDWTERCPASANTNPENCPFPEATAFDHNNNEIPVSEFVYRVTIEDGHEVEAEVQKGTDGQYPVQWEQTGIYLFKYAATDAVGNDAEHIVFELVLDDLTKPTIDCQAATSANVCAAGSKYDACVEVFEQGNAAAVLPKCTYSDLVTPESKLDVKYALFGCDDADSMNQDGTNCNDSDMIVEGDYDTVDSFFSNTHSAFNKLTEYKVTVTVKDDAGIFGANGENNWVQEEYTIDVVDTKSPSIQITGSDSIHMECGTSFMRADAGTGDYIDTYGQVVAERSDDSRFYHTKEVDGRTHLDFWKDPGAVVSDNYDCNTDNNWSGSAARCPMAALATTNLNVYELGEYYIKYDAKDSSGNDAPTQTRSIFVVDNIPPQVELVGPGELEIRKDEQSNYVDFGLTVTDNCDATGNAVVRTPEDFANADQGVITFKYTNTDGNDVQWGDLPANSYIKVYTVMDKSGNDHTVQRTITIVDHNPILSFACPDGGDSCGSVDNVEASNTAIYTDYGAKCEDELHGNLNKAVLITGDVVKMDTPGKYYITYTCKDEANNHAEPITRTVIVADTTCPTVTFNGPQAVKIESGFPFSDAGVHCEDSFDTSLECTAENGFHSYGNNVNYAQSFATAPSCHDILSQHNSATSGTYTIQVTDGAGGFQKVPVFCDMDHARTYYLNSAGAAVSGAEQGACTGYGMEMAAWTDQAEAETSVKLKLDAMYFAGGTTNTYLCSFADENAAGPGKANVEAAAQAFTHANMNPHGKTGLYKITYAAQDAAGNMAACEDGYCACPPVRTVEVQDTLPPVISLRVGDTIVARSQRPSDAAGFGGEDPLLHDTAYITADQGGNPFLSLMAEQGSSAGGWAVAAAASLTVGVALLGLSRKSTDNVPV